MTTYQALKAAALALPEVKESTSYGTPALKVRGKMFVRLREDLEHVVLRTTFDDRDVLLASYPDVFLITDHYRAYPYVLARLEALPEAMLPDVVEMAWRQMAPEGLRKRWEKGRGAGSAD